jgi:hypothetical protein
MVGFIDDEDGQTRRDLEVERRAGRRAIRLNPRSLLEEEDANDVLLGEENPGSSGWGVAERHAEFRSDHDGVHAAPVARPKLTKPSLFQPKLSVEGAAAESKWRSRPWH